jgi:catechol 2,3-dioxygenase-like lactoylglutathione lyase family enzyme
MRIHHVALRTRSVARLKAFYGDLLGLDAAGPPGGTGESVWLDAGGTIVMVEPASEEEPVVPAGTRELIAFRVARADLGRMEARLQAQGVPIEARTGFTIYFRDPDGRRVGLSCHPEE